MTVRVESMSFPLVEVLHRIREAVRPFSPAALFLLAEEGYRTTFELLVACLISVRTRDEVTVPVARRLFARARTAQALLELSAPELADLLRLASFAEVKAQRLVHIAERVAKEYEGVLPCDELVIRSFPGVGPKCANLVLGLACGIPRVAVDVHVHRVTNRWGLVQTRSPEETMRVLEEITPPEYWLDLNRWLVPFGKHICTGRLPRCSICVVRNFCQQVGVTDSR